MVLLGSDLQIHHGEAILYWVKLYPIIMGRTLPPFRPALESEIRSWNLYRQGLTPKERLIFDQLLKFARECAVAGSLSAKPILSEVVFISILVKQQRSIEDLKKQINKLEKLSKK
ncbi:MAG: hypothetical protein ACTSYI_17565 [Promethearchaeota archaeon]